MNDSTLRAGVIGLGMIGSAVATSLARHDVPLAVFDVRDGVADELAGVPPSSASPRDVAEDSDVVIIAVVTAEQAEEVLVGPDGLLSADRPGLVVVLVSTVSLDAVHHLSQLCTERGVVLLDAGVTSGGGEAARDGLVVMIGGPADAIARARPVIDGLARSVIHCGAVGSGMTAKLARNAAQYGRWAVMAEATALAAAGGVSPEVFLRVMEGGADGRDESLLRLRAHRDGVRLTDEQAEAFEALARKDLSAAQDLAEQLGVEVALTNLTPPRMRAVVRREIPEPLPDDAFDRGIAMMEKVMGSGISDHVREAPRLRVLKSTVEHLFAEIWSHPALTIRDRRLLAVGVTSMLGRTDLLTNHLRGALRAGELTTAQLRELSLFLHYYAGWGNGGAVDSVVENLIAEGEDTPAPPATPIQES